MSSEAAPDAKAIAGACELSAQLRELGVVPEMLVPSTEQVSAEADTLLLHASTGRAGPAAASMDGQVCHRRPVCECLWANAIVSHALSCDEDGKALGRQSSSQLSAARESKAIARVTRAFRAERVRSLLDRECLWFRQRRTEQNRRTQVAAAASARAASSAVTAGGSGGSP
jgi:hypothetical protein